MFNKNINFNKNERESKLENPLPSFWETNLVLQLIEELQIKSKTVISWSSWKKKKGIFCIYHFFFVYRLLCFNSMYSVLNTLSEYTYFYILKTLHTSSTFLIVLKIVKSQKCIPKNKYTFTSYQKHYFIFIIKQSQSIRTIYF